MSFFPKVLSQKVSKLWNILWRKAMWHFCFCFFRFPYFGKLLIMYLRSYLESSEFNAQHSNLNNLATFTICKHWSFKCYENCMFSFPIFENASSFSLIWALSVETFWKLCLSCVYLETTKVSETAGGGNLFERL